MIFLKIGYLGPVGTFTQQAANTMFPQGELIPIRDIDGVFESVAQGNCDAGVVPIENSTEGQVNSTLDALLREEEINIDSLLILPVGHALMGASPAGNAEKIFAHPQAHAQCRKYIRSNLPEAELIDCASNGEAAVKVANNAGEPWVAIGSPAAAREYGLYIWADEIQDVVFNSTAFIQIGKTKSQAPKPKCRTSLAFSTENRHGALFRMIGILERYSVNMTKILSRPMPERPGEYVFFVDIEDYRAEDAETALAQIEKEATIYKFLGSYPVSTHNERRVYRWK